MESTELLALLSSTNVQGEWFEIARKVSHGERITVEDGMLLYEKGELGYLGLLSDIIRRKKNGQRVFFNRNFHIEPTNICIYSCTFCAYSRKKGQEGVWEYSVDEILDLVRKADSQATEVHVVGGVHPDHDLHYYGKLIQSIKEIRPDLHVKAFTAVELDFMIKKAGCSREKGLKKLKEYGLDSIPGGGAEIFNEDIRRELCGEKSSGRTWLEMHQAAHEAGIPSNATMLYGHVEKFHHRVSHLDKLRKLQDRTGMFNAFIPLKFKRMNNALSATEEVTIIEDLRNYAISRIFLDNFPHLKAYWPMIGTDVTQLSLSFGVDDFDGTIEDSTKIYAMAGAKEKNPALSTEQIVNLIRQAGKLPVERNSLYGVIREY